jgi:hypothetical protein
MMPETAILSRLGPGARVLIWLGQAPLDEDTAGFATVDYLLDGLVRRHVRQPGPWNQVSFVHTLYGENFWMIYANTANEAVAPFIKSLLVLIPEASRNTAAVMSVGSLAKEWNEALDKTFRSVEHLSVH